MIPDARALFDLTGRIALVTGATRGIGKAIAFAFAQAGARVIISSEDVPACRSVELEMQEQGLAACGIPADVESDADIDELARNAAQRWGTIDVLVCNAGIAGPSGPIAALSAADYERVMSINLRSMVRLTSLVIPGMAGQRGGSVVLMSSISGLRGNKSIGAYALSKAAVSQLARNLAVEWGPKNVRVNSVSPGLIRTEFARPILDDAEYLPRRLALTPLRRVGEPHEIAAAALFLVAPGGAFVTGHNLVVDGGTVISDGN